MDSSHYYHTLTIFITLIGLCYGNGVLPDALFGPVEGNVTLTTTLAPTSTPYLTINWSVNGSNFVTFVSQGNVINVSPAYEGRITLDTFTGSLELRNLALNDSGTYSLNMVTQGGFTKLGSTVLQVLEQVSNPVINASASDVVEFNSSVSLSCSSSGSSPSYHWLNGSSEVTASDNVQLGDGGSTLTIVNVTRYDQGPWRCNVTNRVSNDISQPFNITIYYGPEDTVVEVNPPDGLYVAGSALSLSCSAHSKPVAKYYWFLNGTQLSNEGPELQVVNIQTNQSGSYICQAFNTRTLRQVSSEPSNISVWEKVADVSINPSSQPIIEGMSVNLTCAAAGSISTRKWMKDGVSLSPSDRVSFSGDNKTVSISPVNKQDNGVYLCRVTNPLSFQDAKYNMIVNYGPDSVTIEGPLKIEVGQKFTLTCLTDSTPTANYSWTVNGTERPGQVFTIEKIQYEDSGTYKCTASNDITGLSKHAVHTLEVKAEGSLTESGLSGGAIAGIVIAVLVLVGVAVGLTVYFIKKKDLFNNTSSHGRSASSRAGYNNGGGPADQDLNYADVSHFRKKDGGSVQLGNQAAPVESTDYAEVRVNGKPPSYTAHPQNSPSKRPAPQPGAQPGPTPPSIYSEVRNN
ncbi:carcinoembryonic antigen-related cell adhesion molecule 5-like isoform X2 [Osmerus eperlanus]|uniref:carcinoembryonic antigen-related cell adhesion molecule 5-like isoform X2 n=1 Tax=Osmerus eperlanus TaxID=29151 RepID=UPI002E117863